MNPQIKEVLLNSKVVENKIYLPNIQLDRKDYLLLSKELTALGGKWKGGKISAFVFDFDPQLILDKILNNSTSIKKSTQFFPTPNKIVKEMINMIKIYPMDKVLEPSAGQGAIIEELLKLNLDTVIDYCELEEVNLHILKDKFLSEKVSQVGTNFLELKTGEYDKIIANPPFAKSQDIIHVKHMYDLLSKGGELISLMGTSWKYKTDKKSVEFREWLDGIKQHDIIDVPAGEFSESGTQIATCILKLKK